jgi:hypothetical protein
VVAGQNFDDPTVVVMVTTLVLVIDWYHPLWVGTSPDLSVGLARLALFLAVPILTLCPLQFPVEVVEHTQPITVQIRHPELTKIPRSVLDRFDDSRPGMLPGVTGAASAA